MTRLNGKKAIAWMLAALLAMACGTIGLADADEANALFVDDAVIELELELDPPLIPVSPGSANEETPELVTITFLNARDVLIEAMTLNVGEEIKPLAKDPVRKGYLFEYWYDANLPTVEPFNFEEPAYAANDLTLKARFVRVQEAEAEREAEEEGTPQDDDAVVKEMDETEVASEPDSREGDETAKARPVYMTVNTGGYEVVNLRAEPSMDCAILAQLTAGTVVEVVDELDHWYQVKYDGIDGYIRMDLLDAIEGQEAQAERSDLSEAAVNVWMTYEEGITQIGDSVSMYCEVLNIYGWEYVIHWQMKTADGDWADIEGARGERYSFNFSEGDRGCSWRPIVSVVTYE